MRRETSLKSLDQSQEIWGHNLAEIQSSYGCLVYLAGLRNPNTGRYEHYSSTGPAAVPTNKVLKRIHEEVFNEWIAYSLEQKKNDIELYIESLDQVDKAELIDAWLRLTPYKNLVPASIQGPERQRHVSDLEAILGLLRNVYGVALPDPDA